MLCVACHDVNDSLTVCFTGDVLLDRGVRTTIEKAGVSSIFENVASLFLSSDAVVINLECPATDTISPLNKQFIFRANPEWLPVLHRQGITHAAMANNHIMDQGYGGITDTYNHLKTSEITPIGYGDTQHEACTPCIIEKNNIKVALFNSLLLPVENWICLAQNTGICQAPINQLCERIEAYKGDHPDHWVVVMLHWGVEFQKIPTPLQRKNARQLIDAGADAIVGHHPHVIQNEEIYNGKPIFFSLGNFVFDQTSDDRSTGLAISIKFKRSALTFEKHFVKINRGIPVPIIRS